MINHEEADMSRMVSIIAGTALALVLSMPAVAQGIAQSQPPRPATSSSQEILSAWNNVGRKLVTMAEDFPESKYDFKAQKDQKTFAEQLIHVAAENYRLISAIKGSQMGPAGPEEPSRKEYPTKADVVKLMKQAVADGAALVKEQGDAGLGREVKFPYGNRMVHASFAWLDAIEHSGEHYGQLVVYYRVNDMIPPESRPGK